MNIRIINSMIKLLLFLFCGLLSVAGCTNNVKSDSDNIPDSNCLTDMASKTAEELKWTFSSGTLTVSGKGAMPNYCYKFVDGSYISSSPWDTYRNDITRVVIEDGVTSIGDDAFFRYEHLISVDIPNSVTNIGKEAFSHCGSLLSVTIGNSVTTIGEGAFCNCKGLTEMIIYQEVPPTIDEAAFDHHASKCKLFVPAGSLEAYRSVTGWEIFLIIGAIGEPCLVTAAGIETTAYDNSYIFTWILYNDGILIINGGSMPRYNSITSQGGGAGYGYAPWYDEAYRNSITSVIIGDGIKNISRYAFYQCSNITSVTISGSVADIDNEYTFTGCLNITEIINYRVNPQMIGSDVFKDVYKTGCTLFVPAGYEDAYRVAEGWKDFVNIKAIQ